MGRKPKNQTETVEEVKVTETDIVTTEGETELLTPDEAIAEVKEQIAETEVVETSTENSEVPEISEETEAEENFATSGEVNNEPAWFSDGEIFIQRLKEILNSSQGLDFELINMKKQIFDLIDAFEK